MGTGTMLLVTLHFDLEPMSSTNLNVENNSVQKIERSHWILIVT